MHVLVTGSSGSIGRVVCDGLQAAGHTVRGFDVQPNDSLDDQIVASLTDRPALDRAFAGVEGLVHLAAAVNGYDPYLEAIVEPNIIGLYNVMEAARESGTCHRLVLASTMQVVSGCDWSKPLTGADAAPINHYALSKVYLERMGEMYARVYDLSVIAVRIGWFCRNAGEARRIDESPPRHSVYLSRADACRFFQRALEAPDLTGETDFTVLFGVSLTSAGRPNDQLDAAAAKARIGYEPAERWPEGLPFSF